MVLLTGASGFIGKHLMKALQNKFGYDQVVALVSKPIENGKYLIHDNYSFAENFFVENNYSNIEIIIHAGAFTPKSGSMANDWHNSNSNVIGIHKLLSANFPALKKLIFLSTLDVYANTDDIISEKTATSPPSLYGHSKLYCEKLVRAYSNQNNIIPQILRVGHTYGPGEDAYKKVIPTTIQNLLQGKAPQIWGTGDELRAFIYVEDVVSAIVRSTEYNEYLGEINLVSEQVVTISEVIKKLMGIAEANMAIQYFNQDVKGVNFRFDGSRLKEFLLPEEKPFDDGLKTEWAYFQERLK